MVAGVNETVDRPGRLLVGQRIWLHRGDGPALGMGSFRLLVLVDSTGSLSRAAAEMGMSYSKAWQSIRQSEEATGFPLLERKTGGKGGGGSMLSPQGRWLVAAFSALLDEASETLSRLAEKHLGGWPVEAGYADAPPAQLSTSRGGS